MNLLLKDQKRIAKMFKRNCRIKEKFLQKKFLNAPKCLTRRSECREQSVEELNPDPSAMTKNSSDPEQSDTT
eukprot:scaffold1401_cov70-Cylindrotheca_fusiformis.AAC.1